MAPPESRLEPKAGMERATAAMLRPLELPPVRHQFPKYPSRTIQTLAEPRSPSLAPYVKLPPRDGRRELSNGPSFDLWR
jgi:hypothetical protein